MAESEPVSSSENNQLIASESGTSSPASKGEVREFAWGWARKLISPSKKWLKSLSALTRFLVFGGGLVAILAAYKGLVVTFCPSDTTITAVSGSTGKYVNDITVHVSNTGERPSTLVDYRLNFRNIPIEDSALSLIDEDLPNALIKAHDDVTIHLTVLGLRARPLDEGQPGRFKRTEIDRRIEGQEVTLEIDVKESNDPRTGHLWGLIKPRTVHPLTYPLKAERIHYFIMHWLPRQDVQ